MLRWAMLMAGCAGASFLGLAAGFYTTFPSDEAAAWAEYEFHQRNREFALEVGDVRPWWLPGVRATDVTVYTVKRGKRTKDEPKPGMVRTEMLKFDSLAVRGQVLPLLAGRQAFGFSTSMLGGDLSGVYSQSTSGVELSFNASGLDLAQMPIDKDGVVVHLGGTLSGSSDLVLDAEDVKNSTGALDLVFDGLKLDSGTKVMGVELPVVTFTAARVRFEANEGKLVVTEGTFDGDVLDMTLTGDIALNKKIARSRNRLELAVTLPEDLDRIAKIAPAMKRARDPEGAYHFNVGGTIFSPTFRAGKGVGARVASTDDGGLPGLGRVGAVLGEEGGGDGADPDEAREERRRRREERIKERRERLKKRREEALANGGGSALGEEGDEIGMLEDREGDRRGPRNFGDRDEEFEPGDMDMGAGPPRMDMPDMGPPNNEFPPEEDEFQ
jgi:type II secretion system protein N